MVFKDIIVMAIGTVIIVIIAVITVIIIGGFFLLLHILMEWISMVRNAK